MAGQPGVGDKRESEFLGQALARLADQGDAADVAVEQEPGVRADRLADGDDLLGIARAGLGIVGEKTVGLVVDGDEVEAQQGGEPFKQVWRGLARR